MESEWQQHPNGAGVFKRRHKGYGIYWRGSYNVEGDGCYLTLSEAVDAIDRHVAERGACPWPGSQEDMTIKINVYRAGRTWYGARWIRGQYDGCDPLDIDDDAPVEEAVRAAMKMPLNTEGERIVAVVDDVE